MVDRVIKTRRPVQHCVVNAGKVVLMHKQPQVDGDRAFMRACQRRRTVDRVGGEIAGSARCLSAWPVSTCSRRFFGSQWRRATRSTFSARPRTCSTRRSPARAGSTPPCASPAHATGYWTVSDVEVVAQIRDAAAGHPPRGDAQPSQGVLAGGASRGAWTSPSPWVSAAASTSTPVTFGALRSGCSAPVLSGHSDSSRSHGACGRDTFSGTSSSAAGPEVYWARPDERC